MAGKTTRPTSVADAAEVKRLRDTVEWMDGLAQEGFGQIITIARMAQSCFTSEGGRPYRLDALHAFQIIEKLAGDHENCVNCAAEEVGCNHVADTGARRD